MATHHQVVAAVAAAHRGEWAFVLAATVRVTRDIDIAEECVQDAYARALSSWGRSGVPERPGAWLTTVARRLALDRARRDGTHRRYLPLLIEDRSEPPVGARDGLADDRLRLIFTCCHPALKPEAQVALTLRLVCGLATAEVARSFLLPEATMAARLTRAKKKIAAARIPYRLPPPEAIEDRIDAALTVVYLLFTTGHTAPAHDDLVRVDAVERAVDLARMLQTLLPGRPDVDGLLGLILLTDARRAARVDPGGQLVLLADQDRTLWDRGLVDEGVALTRRALRGRPPHRFALMAAIAAVHAEAPTWSATDWAEIVTLYDILLRRWPSPVVALNRAVAVGFADGPAAGLSALEGLAAEPQLAAYSYLASARADMHRRLGRTAEAATAYTEALMLTTNQVERAFLEERLRQVDQSMGS